MRGDRGDLSRLGKYLAYGTDNNAFNTDCHAAARLAMTETWWNAPCHREGAPLRGDRGDLSRLGKCLANGTDNNAFNTDCYAAARLAMTETWWNAPCHREGAPLRGDRGDLSRLGKCLAYGTDNNAFNTDCYAAARLAMTETWWNAPCHREGAPLRGDRGDLSRLGKCLAYGTDNTRSTQIAMPLRGSQ
ncbi:MAG: hypothetical protein ACYDGL_12465 [Bellilinea sp.]